jgi:hypothetical protein
MPAPGQVPAHASGKLWQLSSPHNQEKVRDTGAESMACNGLNGCFQHLLIQIVDFHESNTNDDVLAAHNRSVVAGRKTSAAP